MLESYDLFEGSWKLVLFCPRYHVVNCIFVQAPQIIELRQLTGSLAWRVLIYSQSVYNNKAGIQLHEIEGTTGYK